MDRGDTESTVDWQRYLTILWARKWALLITVSVVVLAVLLFSLTQTPVYQAQAHVLVQPLPSDPSNAASLQPVQASTEAQIVASQPVATAVSRQLGNVSAMTLLRHVSVQGTGAAAPGAAFGSQVLVVTYSSSDPKLARDAANSFATNYIKYRGQQLLNQIVSAQQGVRATIQKISARLARLNQEKGRARKVGNQSRLNMLQTEGNVLVSRLGLAQQRLDQLQPDSSTQSARAVILNSAELPSSPSSPNLLVNMILALTLGLALGVIVTFLRERLDDRFRGREDVEQTIGAPVLARVPRYNLAGSEASKDPASLSEGFDGGGDATALSEPFSEGFRGLRANLQHLANTMNVQRILVTSPSEGEGKTVTTANLGVALAKSARRVILVSADLRRPALERYFDVDLTEGLTTWLSGTQRHLRTLVKDSGIPNLKIIPAGPPSDVNPGELLTSRRLHELLEVLKPRCDVLLFDTPPILPLSDAKVIAALLDGAILVIDASRTGRSAAAQAKLELEQAGGRVIGCVMNFVDRSSSPYGYYEAAYRSYPSQQIAEPPAPSDDHHSESSSSSSQGSDLGSNQS
jgi:polysaccharide biosynthesis transport protein